MTVATFTPPTVTRPFAKPFERWTYDRGVSVWRSGGVWHQGSDPYWGNDVNGVAGVKDADVVPAADRPGGERTDGTDRDRYLFLGGRVYTVSAAVAATLTAAGYGSGVS